MMTPATPLSRVRNENPSGNAALQEIDGVPRNGVTDEAKMLRQTL